MKILVIGAGAWGTALAVSSASRHQVTLWARDAAQLAGLKSEHTNARYLPGIALPAALALQGGDTPLAQALDGQDLIILATPVSAARGMLQSLQNARAPVAWLSKGFEAPVAAS